MHTTTPRRGRILTAVAATAVAGGALLGGFATTGAANADPGVDYANAKKCTEFINPDGSLKPNPDKVCKPVDPFTEPGLTLAQRKALINTDPNTRASGSAQADFARLEALFGGK